MSKYGVKLMLGYFEFMSSLMNFRSEIYSFTSQLRRAAVSVPANFAEGFKKTGLKDKIRFYNIAPGSLEECRYYLILARDLGYGDSNSLMTFLEEVSRIARRLFQRHLVLAMN